MEVEVPDWLCEKNGLNDGDGIEDKAVAKPPAETARKLPAPKPGVVTDTVTFDLLIDSIVQDGAILVVEPIGIYNDKQELEPIDKHGEVFELYAFSVSTDDKIRAGATITATVPVPAAVSAGLIKPPRKLWENTKWLKKDTIPYSFDLTDEDKIRLAKQMAEAQGKIANLELELAETRKSLKAEIDVLQDQLNEAAKIFRFGKSDPVPVKCDVIQDWNTDELVWVTADEEALELLRRKMTPEEKQRSLFKDPPDKI